MTTRGTVSIIGGSMAGLFAGIALRARGYRVNVYERAGDALANRGAGIATHTELYAAVRGAGIELRDEMGVQSVGRLMLAADGSEIHRHDYRQTMSSWGLIYRFLRAQFDDSEYHLDHSLVALNNSAQGVEAEFANGRRIHSDWLIGADGARSTVRGLVAPQIVPQYAGYFGWRGLFEEARVPPAVLQQVAGRITFGMAPSGHWLGYLVAGPDDDLEVGRRRYNWAWYRTTSEADYIDHLTDDSGHYHSDGIPHGSVRANLIEAMRAESRTHLAPQFQAIIAATPQPFLQGIYDFLCERLIYQRVALIGDAACTARPHVGMGVSKAAEDAATLAAAMVDDDPANALAAWEQQRVAYGRAVVRWGRDLGSYIGPQPDDESHRRKALYHQRPEILLSITATSLPEHYLTG